MPAGANLSDARATRRVLSLARTLLAKGGVLESTNGSERIDRSLLAEALERRIEVEAATSNGPGPSVTAKVAAAEAIASAEAALQKTASNGSSSNLTDLEVASLEAIIEVTGRPAMRYSNGKVQTPPSALGENGHWQVVIVTARHKINRSSASVGCIALTNNAGIVEPVGTGWCARGDLVVTNRHVVQDLVENPDSPPTEWRIDKSKQAFIDFAVTDGATVAQRFEIAEVSYIAMEAAVDIALVRVTSGSTPVPEALTVNWDKASTGREIIEAEGNDPVFQGREIYIVGHPYRQRFSSLVATVFGVADGHKRWSPGLVKKVGPQDPTLEHDCSTLGGNSGSCVLTADEHEVIGIHMGGVHVDQVSGQGTANLALALSRLTDHPAAAIIRNGSL